MVFKATVHPQLIFCHELNFVIQNSSSVDVSQMLFSIQQSDQHCQAKKKHIKNTI